MSLPSVSTHEAHITNTEQSDEYPQPDTQPASPESEHDPHHVRAVAEQLQGRTWTNLGDVFFRPTADKKAATIRVVEQSAAGLESDRRMADAYARQLIEYMESRNADEFRPEKIVQTFTVAFRAASKACTHDMREAA